MYRGTNRETGLHGDRRATVSAWCIVSAIALVGCDHAVTTNKKVSIDTPFKRVVVETTGRDSQMDRGTSMDVEIVGGNRTTAEIDLTLHHMDDAPFEGGIVEEAYDFDTSVEDGTLVIRLGLNDDVFCLGGDLTVVVPSRVDVEVIRTDGFPLLGSTTEWKKNTVLVEGVSGDVAVSVDRSDVSLAAIDGDIRVDVRESGEVSFAGIRGSIAAAVEFSDLSLSDLDGDVDIHILGFGSVKGEMLRGRIGSFFTAGGDLTLSQADYTDRLDLDTQEGDVRLTLDGAAYDIDARAPNGTAEVSSSLTEGDAESTVNARTMFGDIRIDGI